MTTANEPQKASPQFTPAERKARQRERHAVLGIQRIEVKLSARERDQLTQLCHLRAGGSESYSADEYISTLIRRDWERWLEQESIFKQHSCPHCDRQLPAGCGGAFSGESVCWLTRGKHLLFL